ncbi:MAG: mucoidy inhibitor MuiA family protein [Flavobacteriia bacterium]|nr:mucoidy inhibitor MuiA family protein [Flavobacteriia bacterium]
MKKIWLFACLTLTSTLLWANDKDLIKSTLSEVTVFSQGAQMHHKANYTLKPGITELSIEGISSYIDPKSLQLKATGNVIIIDTKYTLFYPQPEPKAVEGIPLKIKKEMSQISDSIETLLFDLNEIQDEINVLKAAQNIISNNGAVKGQGKVNDSINLLKSTVEYYSNKMNEINKKMLALEKRKKEKGKTKDRLQQRYNDLSNYQNQTDKPQNNNASIPRIVVTLSSSEAVTGKISFSYVIANAGWTPIYDIRSESTTGKISLTYKAQVHQTSGMDWDNVKLNISTNNPYANKTKPTLNPWYVDYYNNYEMLREDINIKTINAIPQSAFNQGYFLNKKDNSDDDKAMTADQFTTVVHQLISAEFKIDLPYSIKSNNEQHLVLVKTTELNTTFKYFAVPKVDPGVYLVAQMTKLDELQLVPANANIFFDGSYIGETYIDPTSMDDTLNLSLGKDPNINVKRTLLKKDCKDRIIQDKRERTFSYQIDVINNKSSNIELIIQDQVPMTTNGDITIEVLDKGGANELPGTGVLEWKMNLKPKDTKKITFGYRIKHPKDQQINL